MGEFPATVPFEELPAVKAAGEPVTREMMESNPDILRAIRNVYGINVDMTPPQDPAPDPTP